jgi:DNA-binding LacI/PurR family transcriptional regulator
MADVARLAGVSHQTVSRVLNDHPNVRPATRGRVLAAIEELGYRPNLSARALASRRTNTIGVVAFDTTLYGPASTLLGIEHAARAAGYFVSIVSLRELTLASVSEAVEHLSLLSVDGLVVIAPQRSATSALLELPRHVPLVTVEGSHDIDVPVVCVDQRLGARRVTEHLLRLGHRTVWHIAGPPDWLEAEGRVEGWREALTAAGALQPEPLVGDWSPLSGYRCGQVLAGQQDLTAVFVGNDQMALGMLRAFAEAGIRVPEDVSVAGFDDIPEADFFAPPLTTVRQDFAEVGRRSIDTLLQQMDRDSEMRSTVAKVVVEPHLVVRRSTARAPRIP